MEAEEEVKKKKQGIPELSEEIRASNFEMINEDICAKARVYMDDVYTSAWLIRSDLTVDRSSDDGISSLLDCVQAELPRMLSIK